MIGKIKKFKVELKNWTEKSLKKKTTKPQVK
jgi:hypothetical protein